MTLSKSQHYRDIFSLENVLFAEGLDGRVGPVRKYVKRVRNFFFILKYIKHYTHIYLNKYLNMYNICIKLSAQISCGF